VSFLRTRRRRLAGAERGSGVSQWEKNPAAMMVLTILHHTLSVSMVIPMNHAYIELDDYRFICFSLLFAAAVCFSLNSSAPPRAPSSRRSASRPWTRTHPGRRTTSPRDLLILALRHRSHRKVPSRVSS
jgi:hypothetical protein